MFRRKFEDINNFQANRYPGLPTYQGNPDPNETLPPHEPRSPFGSPPFFRPPSHFKPPFPMTLEGFKEMKYIMILMILSDNPEGITGYQLQERFNMPRGNLLRTLDDLVELKYVKTSESVIKGRAQKFFIITEEGKKYLGDLKKKWIERVSQMPEFAAPVMQVNFFIKKGLEMILSHQLDLLETKEDGLDLFRGLRSKLKMFMSKMAEVLKYLKITKTELDSIIQKIEEMDVLNIEEIKEMIKEFKKKLEK
ncbi:MAG: PadR family transcriptional regulator [Candidatus Hermodarchaeota archaeon]